MRLSLPPITLEDLSIVGYADLQTHMIEHRWRTELQYMQRRITPRQDKSKSSINGWRVSHEKGIGSTRDRIQQSFYFSTKGGFEQTTAQAQEYRDRLELEQGLVAWRLKPVDSLENAFCVAGLSLQIVKGRAPFWIYRDAETRISASIATHGLRGAYLDVAKRVYALDDESPLPVLTPDETQALIVNGHASAELIEQEALYSYQWVRNFLLRLRKEASKAA